MAKVHMAHDLKAVAGREGVVLMKRIETGLPGVYNH